MTPSVHLCGVGILPGSQGRKKRPPGRANRARSGPARDLAKIEESHCIQQAAPELAERRVESTTLLQQVGRASTWDFLDAQEDLLEAQDAVTDALIDHAVAKLGLARDMGVLKVDGEGLRYEAEGALAEF